MKTILQNPQTNATVQVGMINEFRPNCYMNTTKPAPKPAVKIGFGLPLLLL